MAEGTGQGGQSPVSFKDTLNLPHTQFPIRPQAAVDDPQLVSYWHERGIIQRAMKQHEGGVSWIIHDGPPYANGDIHLGHAYNKILKDTLTKAHRMMGYHVPVIPGWDCHGLPIEQKVSQDIGEADSVTLKQACRAYAQRWIDAQCASFKRLGIFMDWEHPYITMAPSYEGATVHAFAQLVRSGSISRNVKTVPWCPTCRTALASAEIEYQDRKDPSVYVRFIVHPEDAARVCKQREQIAFLIWTTTPWTLPLNRAVVLRPGTRYALVRSKNHRVIIGESLVPTLERLTEQSVERIAVYTAEELSAVRVEHPVEQGRTVPVILDHSVGTDEGTACVHNAPGCGPVDYELGVKNNLEIYSPISADGRYTSDICLPQLVDMPVADGQTKMITILSERGTLFHKTSIRHSYPHCWRSRDGLIFRATPQWFFNLNHNQTKDHALAAIEHIHFTPAQGQRFLSATIENRWEWCLSRQRQWGVPIIALLHADGKTYYAEPAFIEAVAERISVHGIEWWDGCTIEQLVHEGILPNDFPVADYRKERDILDVWFDSGISHYAVLRPHNLFPADLYLEGIDQHRGWFQSSLLTSMVLSKEAPMRGIMTHGFTVDEKGQKMSKSLGNVIAPQQIIDQLGTDGLRLWVASIGYDGDAVVSKALLANVSEVYRKVRNTCRFLLQNVHEYDHVRDAVAVDNLLPLDRYALMTLYAFNIRMIAAYRAYNLTAVFHGLAEYCARDLSSHYLDMVKDRLYCGAATGHDRRSAQTVVWYILDTLTRLMAPILSFTSELVTREYAPTCESVHLEGFARLMCIEQAWGIAPAGSDARMTDEWIRTRLQAVEQRIDANAAAYSAVWDELFVLRDAVLKGLEELREQGVIRHSLEASVYVVYSDTDRFDDIKRILGVDDIASLIKEFCIVSQVSIEHGSPAERKTDVPGVTLSVSHAEGVKCPRCWQWSHTIDKDGLCPRCERIVRV